MSDDLIAIEFDIPNEKYPVEGINIDTVPREGERVKVSARFDDDGKRIDPNEVDALEYYDLEFGYVLSGTVQSVARSYHSSAKRSECTVNVSLIDVEWNGGEKLDTDD